MTGWCPDRESSMPVFRLLSAAARPGGRRSCGVAAGQAGDVADGAGLPAGVVAQWLPKLITSRSQHSPDLRSYGDSNSGPLACHAMEAFISSYGENPFFGIIAARDHTIGIT